MMKCSFIHTQLTIRPTDTRIIKGYKVWNKVLEQVSRVIDIFYFSSQLQPSKSKIVTIWFLSDKVSQFLELNK